MMDFDLTENDMSVIMEIAASMSQPCIAPEPVKTLPETDAPWSPPTRFIRRGQTRTGPGR